MLRVMGAGFFLGGLAFVISMPVVRLMGGIWMGVGVLLLVVAQVVAAGAAHRKQLLATGKVGRATIVAVADTGITVNNSPRARVTVRIDVPGEAPVQGTCAMMVSRVAPPRVGSVCGVRFDPKNPNDFVFDHGAPVDAGYGYAPVAAAGYGASSAPYSAPGYVAPAGAPDPLIAELERLTSLRDRGALTHEEFEQQKHRLLERR